MKKFFILMFAALFLMVAPLAAMADSISPESFSATLAVGDSTTISKTVTVSAGPPTTSKVDVYFLADTTGSMGSYINAVRNSAASILSSTAGLGDVQFAVGEYKDFTDFYAYRLNTAMTSVQANAQAGINLWAADGGADWAEANLNALTHAASDLSTGWRTGSARILVWFGDAPGHDPSGGSTLASTTTALTGMNIKVQAIDVGSMNAYGQASYIASATGGAYLSGINSSTIVATIQSAITTTLATYTNVGLDLSEAPAGVTVTATPGYTGSFDRSTEQTFGFEVTFTGVTPGDYAFDIYGTVDGGRVATERDRITVGVVPEPATFALFGIGLIAMAGFSRKKN